MAKNVTTPEPWLESLRDHVTKRPLVIFRLTGDDKWHIEGSHNGISRFTIARPQELFRNVRLPTACLVLFDDGITEGSTYFATISRSQPNTTLEKRVRIEGSQAVEPRTTGEMLELVDDKSMATNFRNRLNEYDDVVPLSPKLSSELVSRLAEIDDNAEAMRVVMSGLVEPKHYDSNVSIQHDAVRTALSTFGIGIHERARLVEIEPSKKTSLDNIRIYEDVVIQEDARRMPGFVLTNSVDLTGRAVFERQGERLEVITANKLPLEEVLGVDLIYYNSAKKNIVAVQYKMLESDKSGGSDWIYRPDKQLAKELARMHRFSTSVAPGPLEFRLNPQVFYFKFVRRDAVVGKSTQTMPIDHYEVLEKDPKCRGPKGGFKISYETLDGRYMRQGTFVELISSGYIGAYADTTAALIKLVDETLKDGRAVVAAIQSTIEYPNFADEV